MADGDKKKKSFFGRRAYLDDFKKDESGNYAYAGSYRVCDREGEEFKKWLASCWVFLAAAAACLLACGFIPRTGMDGRAYIILPYAVAVAITAACVVKFVTPSGSGGRLPVYRFEKSLARLPLYAAIGAVLCGFSLVGLLLDLFRGESSGVMPNVAVTGVLLAAAGSFLALFIPRLRAVNWTKE